ncbi:MAG: phytanoyl-CoA dioxygenase family protein, partial [Planctomycetota bacterium]|nr:phytanoyl-CoA dioxygenase family protein [Planctomycetota bacterium]
MTNAAAQLQSEGYFTMEDCLTTECTRTLADLCEPLWSQGDGKRPGIRRVLARCPALAGMLSTSPIPGLIEMLCGRRAHVVRSILFDKTPETNWLVPWHQDATIALAARHDIEGFGPWSIKEGEHHCRPPRWLIDQVAVIRIHLDACGIDNGPLRVIPGSHRDGLLSDAAIAQLAAAGPVHECCVGVGGIVGMRPHTVHASRKATVPARRRVLHLECTAAALPAGLG